MNAPPPPPRPPPRPAPAPLEPDATTYQEVPPIVASVPPPPGVPIVSVRVPSLAPGGAPGVLSGPPGTQVTIPGLPPSVGRWLRAHAIHLVVLLVAAILTWAGKCPSSVLTAILSLILGIQVDRPRVPGEGPIVIATVPPASSPPPSPYRDPPSPPTATAPVTA